jgi:hypothetical protein
VVLLCCMSGWVLRLLGLLAASFVCIRRVEHNVYGLLRTRDMAIARYKEFSIPTQWMLDSGVVGRVLTLNPEPKYLSTV